METNSAPAKSVNSPLTRKTILIICLVVALIIGVFAAFMFTREPKDSNSNIDASVANDERIRKEQEDRMKNQNRPSGTITPSTTPMEGGDLGDANSTDPVEIGKALSGGKCTGTGSKTLGSAPMRPDQMSMVIPYGLMAGGHVTPIDHQYYWGKVPMGNPDMYDVLSPADGKLVSLQYRDRSSENQKVKGDYRGVIMYSCTFFSYFDLATSISADIQAQLPKGWEKTQPNQNTNITLKEGQVIGKVGGQSLDFAVWDTTKRLKNLLVPVAYNNLEPWKIVTVSPLDYFSSDVKTAITPFFVRKESPIDGIIDQDIDGKAVGSWFLEGTNGYAGVFEYGNTGGGQMGYWSGHLSIVRDHLDPTGWVFSHGNINGQPLQFGIKTPSVNPDKLDKTSGMVRYELIDWRHIDEKGMQWVGMAKPKSISMLKTGMVKGTVLVQMLDTRKLKIEVFMGKTSSQVSGFTANAKIYDRGDNAKMIKSNTAN